MTWKKIGQNMQLALNMHLEATQCYVDQLGIDEAWAKYRFLLQRMYREKLAAPFLILWDCQLFLTQNLFCEKRMNQSSPGCQSPNSSLLTVSFTLINTSALLFWNHPSSFTLKMNETIVASSSPKHNPVVPHLS